MRKEFLKVQVETREIVRQSRALSSDPQHSWKIQAGTIDCTYNLGLR